MGEEERDLAPSQELPPPASGAPDKPRKRRPIRRIAAVVVVLLALGLPSFSTMQPGYYSRYPELRIRMQYWAQSTHARMSCVSCHVDPGPVAFMSFFVRSIPAFYAQLLGGSGKTNLLGVPDRRACQSCHTSYREVSPSGDLLMPHRAHVEILKIGCAVCHTKLVHWPNPLGFNRPDMMGCMNTCHNGKKATATCSKCHTNKAVPDNHKAANWLKVHGQMQSKINCGKCHGWSPHYCETCHSVRPASHKGNWKTAHAVRGRLDAKGCKFCHGGEKFCKKCH
jgi:hypothetical protein